MNNCVFSGRLAKDAETRYTQSGTAITTFCMAVKSGFGEHEATSWINCNLWKREKVAVYLKKGSLVTVSGELQVRKYEDKNGVERQSVEITVRDFDLPPKPKDSGADGGYQNSKDINNMSQPDWDNKIDEVPF